MGKKKMSRREIAKSKRLAKKLKRRPGVDNPHALARSVVKKGRRKKR